MTAHDIDYVLRTVEERDIRFIRLWFTDVLGFLKSFAITPAELEAAFDEGMGFDGSAIEGFARVQESDMLARPDPSTFQILPWRPDQQGVARMFCDILTPEGEPFAGDPRAVPARDRPSRHRRADDGRQRHDCAPRGEGSGAGSGRVRDVHAEAHPRRV